MNTADRAIVAAAEERDRETDLAWPAADWVLAAFRDRRELLRIVRDQEALLRERDTQAEDAADDAAAERATAGKWGAS